MGHPTAGEFIERAMRLRGWNPQRLAEMTGGRVSGSSIRAYMTGRSTPRPDKALLIAETLGPVTGETLLRLFGYEEAARGFAVASHLPAASRREAADGTNHLAYPGPPLADDSTGLVLQFITWIQSLQDP